jgi:hypothetical protein
MAKVLSFQYSETVLSFDFVKVDRAKLYGSKEIEVLDEDDEPCELGTLAGDGKTLVGRGGTAVGYLTVDGLWCDRTELTPVNLEGQPIKAAPSSFDAPIPLMETISVEQYLDYDIRIVYLLRGAGLPPELDSRLRRGEIFRFTFSFRGGVEADPAFMLMNLDGELFLLVAKETNLHFIALQQAAAVEDETQQPEDEGESEELDFSMI